MLMKIKWPQVYCVFLFLHFYFSTCFSLCLPPTLFNFFFCIRANFCVYVFAPGPQLAPLAKVRSRLTVQLPVGCQQDICQADLISPIGRINLSPSTGPKVSVQSVCFRDLFLSHRHLLFWFSFCFCRMSAMWYAQWKVFSAMRRKGVSKHLYLLVKPHLKPIWY